METFIEVGLGFGRLRVACYPCGSGRIVGRGSRGGIEDGFGWAVKFQE